MIVNAKLVVGYWELISMESGAELLASQDTSPVRVAKDTFLENKERTSW